MSQNSGNFLQNGNTVHDVQMRQVMNIIHQRVNIHFAPKPSFFDPAVELDAGLEPNAAHRIQKRILRPLHPPARGLDLPFGQTNAPQFSYLINIHFAPKTRVFFDPAVEPDAGREPNAAHRIQKRILPTRHPPARGLDLPFVQTNAPKFSCFVPHEYSKTQFFRSRGRTRRRTRTKRGAPDTKTNSPSSAPTGSRPRSPVRPNERPPIILCLINIHFAPKTQGFLDPAVEPDAGREPNAAHRIQLEISLKVINTPAPQYFLTV